MATFNCKFAIFESQQAVILLEVMVLLIIVALLAGVWVSFYVQSSLAERALIIRLEALHLAASSIDRMRASSTKPLNTIEKVDDYTVCCKVYGISHISTMWIVAVVVEHKYYHGEVVRLATCIAL